MTADEEEQECGIPGAAYDAGPSCRLHTRVPFVSLPTSMVRWDDPMERIKRILGNTRKGASLRNGLSFFDSFKSFDGRRPYFAMGVFSGWGGARRDRIIS